MEFTVKEKIWFDGLNKEVDEKILSDINSDHINAHILELQAFCNKLFLKLRKAESRIAELAATIQEFKDKTNIKLPE
jgi:hypothetical protein